jgi:Peptidase A4 family
VLNSNTEAIDAAEPQPQQQFIPLEPNSIRKKEENTMKNILKPVSIAFGFGLMLTTLGQAQPGAPSGTPLTFKVPPKALSAISFSAAPNVQCSVAPANGSSSGKAFTVYTNDQGTATFYVTPSQASSAAQLVATCSSGNQQTIQIQPVVGAKPLVAPAPSDAAANARLGYTVRPALTGDPMALSNQELVKLKYPMRPDPQKAPGAYASWLKAVSKPATLIPPKMVKVEGRSHGPVQISAGANTQSARLATSDTATPITSFTVNSEYASGYMLATDFGSQFLWIEGEWNVPALVGGEEGVATSSDLGIALGGLLVQAGTAQDAIGYDGPIYFNYYPWIEVYPQQDPVAITNFTVNPADEIFCQLYVADSNGDLNQNGGYAWFDFEDFTTGQSTLFPIPMPPGPFSGHQAAWLMQRSQYTVAQNGIADYYDLSDYYYALMQAPYAGDGNGNYVNYLGQGGGDIGIYAVYQFTMTSNNGDGNTLSTAPVVATETIQFNWSNFH